ncbi:hypothetical protein EGK_17261, partial [Macaca mulatta]
LLEKIRGSPDITCVFLNVERMAAPTKKELEAAWGVEVFDRFTVVLHIFRCNARTKEARLQVALAEIPLHRSNLKRDVAHLHRGAGSRYIMGSGNSAASQGVLGMRSKTLFVLSASKQTERRRGYPGRICGTICIRNLPVRGFKCEKKHPLKTKEGDEAAQSFEDPPRGRVVVSSYTAPPPPLPGRSASLGSDTRSFAALTARPGPQDLIVHVRDVSHPEVELQKRSVLSTLHSLQLPAPLLDSMVEVHNKVDLVPGYSPTEPNAVPVSALLGHGLQELKAELDAAVLKATGRQILTLRVRLAGAQLSWLYKEATVQDVDVIPEDGAADVTVIISDSAYGKFRKLFPG